MPSEDKDFIRRLKTAWNLSEDKLRILNDFRLKKLESATPSAFSIFWDTLMACIAWLLMGPWASSDLQTNGTTFALIYVGFYMMILVLIYLIMLAAEKDSSTLFIDSYLRPFSWKRMFVSVSLDFAILSAFVYGGHETLAACHAVILLVGYYGHNILRSTGRKTAIEIVNSINKEMEANS